jgi:hypothetical protein
MFRYFFCPLIYSPLSNKSKGAINKNIGWGKAERATK